MRLTLLLTSTTLSVSLYGIRYCCCCCCLDISLPWWPPARATADKTIHLVCFCPGLNSISQCAHQTAACFLPLCVSLETRQGGKHQQQHNRSPDAFCLRVDVSEDTVVSVADWKVRKVSRWGRGGAAGTALCSSAPTDRQTDTTKRAGLRAGTMTRSNASTVTSSVCVLVLVLNILDDADPLPTPQSFSI